MGKRIRRHDLSSLPSSLRGREGGREGGWVRRGSLRRHYLPREQEYGENGEEE